MVVLRTTVTDKTVQENSRDGEKQSEERRSARQRGELRLEGRGSWKGMKKYPERVLRTGR